MYSLILLVNISKVYGYVRTINTLVYNSEKKKLQAAGKLLVVFK